MHSKIFQISSRPISKDDYASPSRYYENSNDFADYIGDEVADEDRENEIGWFANVVKDVFTAVGDGVLAYKGKKALQAFKQKWADGIKAVTNELTVDNLFMSTSLYRIGEMTTRTHMMSDYRVDIGDWCSGAAYPLGELFEYADSQLKEGDYIYIGAIIDYHF